MSVARQAVWAFVGTGGQQVIRFICVVVLARLLTPTEFGIVAAAQIILAFADTFADFGIGVGLLRAKGLDRITERSAMTVIVVSSAVIAILIAGFAGPLAGFLGIPEVKRVLPWLAAAFLLDGASGPIVQLMYRGGRYREVSIAQLLSAGFGYGAVSIPLAAMGWGYWAIVVGSVSQTLIQFLMVFWFRPVWPTLRPKWASLRPILRFGFGVLSAVILNTCARRGDNWVAGRFLGASALGFYSRAYSIMDLANQLPGVVVGRVLMPHFARRAHDEKQARAAARNFYVSHGAAAVMTLPASVATVLLAPDIIGILLGARWGAAAPVLAILGIGVFLRLAYKVSSTVVLAYGASWRSALREGVYATLVVGGSILGMRDGLTGIAWAVLLALAWQFWAQTQLALTIIGGKWASLAAALVPLFLATAAAATGGVLADALLGPLAGHWARLIVVGAAIGAPYCLCLWLLRQTETVASLVRASTTLFRRHGAAEVEATQRLELRSREETV